ncbi:MAG: hypothetical protein ABJI60_15145 [Kangiellaceae bacterium]|jgi:hypothetical protein
MKRTQLPLILFIVAALFMAVAKNESVEEISPNVVELVKKQPIKAEAHFSVLKKRSPPLSIHRETRPTITSVLESLQMYDDKLRVYFDSQKFVYYDYKTTQYREFNNQIYSQDSKFSIPLV